MSEEIFAIQYTDGTVKITGERDDALWLHGKGVREVMSHTPENPNGPVFVYPDKDGNGEPTFSLGGVYENMEGITAWRKNAEGKWEMFDYKEEMGENA